MIKFSAIILRWLKTILTYWGKPEDSMKYILVKKLAKVQKTKCKNWLLT